jgi:hypothetical protein
MVDSAPPSPRTSVAASASANQSSAAARWARFARPVAGASIAAGVAAMSIMWLRTQEGPEPMLASNPVPETIVLAPEATGTTVALNNAPATERVPSNGEPDRYVTPAPSSTSSIAPPARLANYVVAHSEYSGPLSRRMALLGLVATDSEIVAPAEPNTAAGTAPRDQPGADDAR